jgi:gas vesicle protein
MTQKYFQITIFSNYLQMKNSGLLIGLGVGLLIGTAIGLYIASGIEDKAELLDEINAKVDNAKKSIGKVVEQGLEELDKATEIASQVAQDTISKMKSSSAE